MNIFEEEYIEPKEEEKAELIAELNSGNYYLSFSSITKFAISPKAFISYKVQEKKETDAMVQGRMLHAYILEPDTIDDQFIIMPDAPLNTVEGKGIVAKWCEDNFGFEFELNKQKNPIVPKLDDLKKMIAIKDGRTVAKRKVADGAKEAALAVIRNKAAMSVLNQIEVTEQKFETTFRGVKFKGAIDGKGKRVIVDLKQVPNATVEGGTGAFYSRKMGWQLAGYNRATGGSNSCFTIMVDGTGEVLVTQVSSHVIERSERSLAKVIDIFKECVLYGMTEPEVWDMSQDFWLRTSMNQHGYNVI